MTNGMRLLPQNRLYAITDRRLGRRSNDEIVGQLLLGGARLIQLRDKDANARELLEMARACLKLTRAMKATLIVNDRVDVAMSAGTDGVHLGQDDMKVEDAREIVGADVIIGLSTHSIEQIRAGLETSADYLAVGPIYATATKDNPDPAVGLELLREARAISNRPIVAIGGITGELARDVVEAGADYVAAIAALYPPLNFEQQPEPDGIISRVRALDVICNSL
jgi:thiamine-phosphate pyrophosphorylase